MSQQELNNKADSKKGMGHLKKELTREELAELEKKEMTPREKAIDVAISFLPIIGALIAIAEYLLIENKYSNPNPERYLIFLLIPAIIYFVFLLMGLAKYKKADKKLYEKVRYKSPFYFALYMLLTGYDILTLKTGFLTQPFIPWVNKIINAAIIDWDELLNSTIHSLGLLFLGYGIGVVVGLITGIACGYSKRVKYWINPIVQVLGPIPTATWIPLLMVLMSLFGGAVFIVALGTWFAVTTASMTGISTIDKSYYDAAKTLGASSRQLVLNVAIPHAMPSILQGMTQGMNSACISLMIAEMMGVEAGLGWYITWVKAWASYDKMFAAIVVICLTFNAVAWTLNTVKKHVLRWQEVR